MGIGENILWFVLCIYFEAMGESLAGKVAVGHVIMNRVERRDASVVEIVKAPRQFSWLNREAREPVVRDFDALLECVRAAYLCISERFDGKDLFGADHYHTTEVHPYWADEYEVVARIGNHIFYKS